MLLGCIADDLTGGVELASMLIARGVPTSLSIGIEVVPRRSASHVIALKSRVAPVSDAVSDVIEAARLLQEAGSRQIFFKYCATFDSTPAGNIGPCAEALMELLGSDFTVFCPSFCEVGRTVFQGHLFAGRELLAESPKRFDPLTPMTDSNLLRVLAAQSTKAVGLLPHAAVHRGAGSVREHIETLRRESVALAIADAIYEEDLAAIAEACADLPLLTGNSSVAAHLPDAWRRRKLLTDEPPDTLLQGVEGHGAVLAGSCAERTGEQLRHFEALHPVLHLDLRRSFEGEDLFGQAAAWAAAHIERGPLAISTAASHREVSELQAEFGRATVAQRAESLLSDLARHLVHDLGVRRMIIAGGETSGSVLGSLGVRELTVGPYEGPGISRVIAEQPVRLALVLKSGKLGPVDMFAPMLEAMRRTRPVSGQAGRIDHQDNGAVPAMAR